MDVLASFRLKEPWLVSLCVMLRRPAASVPALRAAAAAAPAAALAAAPLQLLPPPPALLGTFIMVI